MALSDSVASPAPAESLERWQRAAGPFWPYVCAAPFISPLAENDLALPVKEQRWSRTRKILRIVEDVQDRRTAFFIDLAPEQTLRLTRQLNCLNYVVVPVIQRWAVSGAVIRSESLVQSLARFGAQASFPHGPWERIRGAVFLLDGLRCGRPAMRPATSPTTDGSQPGHTARARLIRRFDNRYTYPICRFPPPSLLRQLQFSALATIPPVPAPDLLPYCELLKGSGFVHLRPSSAQLVG